MNALQGFQKALCQLKGIYSMSKAEAYNTGGRNVKKLQSSFKTKVMESIDGLNEIISRSVEVSVGGFPVLQSGRGSMTSS